MKHRYQASYLLSLCLMCASPTAIAQFNIGNLLEIVAETITEEMPGRVRGLSKPLMHRTELALIRG